MCGLPGRSPGHLLRAAALALYLVRGFCSQCAGCACRRPRPGGGGATCSRPRLCVAALGAVGSTLTLSHARCSSFTLVAAVGDQRGLLQSWALLFPIPSTAGIYRMARAVGSEALGVLLAAPLILAWSTVRLGDPSLRVGGDGRGRALRITARSPSARCLRPSGDGAAVSHLITPFLVWAALRFHIRGAASAVSCGGGRLWNTASGNGPFAAALAPGGGVGAALAGIPRRSYAPRHWAGALCASAPRRMRLARSPRKWRPRQMAGHCS